MKFFENLPLIVFGLVFFVSSIILVIGIFLSASAEDTVRLEKGKKMLMRAVYSFSSLLLIVIVFSTITWFLDKNVREEPENLDGYPASPVDPNFPSAPTSIEISKFYFNGPYPFQDYSLISKSAIFSVLCKNEEDYDIIDIDSASAGDNLFQHDNAECWSSVCENMYIGILWKPTGKEVVWNQRAVLEFLKNENNLLCPIEQ